VTPEVLLPLTIGGPTGSLRCPHCGCFRSCIGWSSCCSGSCCSYMGGISVGFDACAWVAPTYYSGACEDLPGTFSSETQPSLESVGRLGFSFFSSTYSWLAFLSCLRGSYVMHVAFYRARPALSSRSFRSAGSTPSSCSHSYWPRTGGGWVWSKRPATMRVAALHRVFCLGVRPPILFLRYSI